MRKAPEKVADNRAIISTEESSKSKGLKARTVSTHLSSMTRMGERRGRRGTFPQASQIILKSPRKGALCNSNPLEPSMPPQTEKSSCRARIRGWTSWNICTKSCTKPRAT